MLSFFSSIYSLIRRAASEDASKKAATKTGAAPETVVSAAPSDYHEEMPFEISVRDVKQRLDKGETLHLIDVREPFEFETAHIAGATLIPMRQVPAHLQELETKADEAPLIVFCHHGVRSLNVVSWLREQGVANCVSMAGGIDAWSAQADSSVPRY